MAAEWFYTTNKQQMGPVSWNELRELAEVGILKSHDMVWTDGMDEWVKAINQQGLLADGEGNSTKKASYSDAKPPPGRHTKPRREVDEDEEDDEDKKESKRKARQRAEESAKTWIGIRVGLILAGVLVALLVLGGCVVGLIWATIGLGGGGGDRGPRNYTVSNLREKTVNDRAFTFTQGKRVIITCTNQTQFNNTDVDLRVLRDGNARPGEQPLVADDRLPQFDHNCRVEFVVPATDTYRVRLANLGPGMANSCQVVIEER
ncbi:MAG: DUF4339 domain-containing protein [Gemmataceae bacterium]|nr:DUF4339 domain-containing protein [Gemmataceae bacterium]